MSTLSLKSDLHQLIRETDDPKILQKIKETFFSLRNENEPVISEKERRMMEIGLNQIKNGQVKSNQEVRSKIKKWIQQNQ